MEGIEYSWGFRCLLPTPDKAGSAGKKTFCKQAQQTKPLTTKFCALAQSGVSLETER